MSRCLVNAFIKNATVSGRHGKNRRVKQPYEVVPAEFPRAIREFVKKGSICPICGKVIELTLGVQKSADRWHIVRDPQSPSCDRKVNGGTGYILNNVQITHRCCNKARQHSPLPFHWENTEWNPTKDQSNRIHLRNQEIVRNNFRVTNPQPIINRTDMKTPTNASNLNILASQLSKLTTGDQLQVFGIVYINTQLSAGSAPTIHATTRAPDISIDVVKKIVKMRDSGMSHKDIIAKGVDGVKVTASQVASARERLREHTARLAKA